MPPSLLRTTVLLASAVAVASARAAWGGPSTANGTWQFLTFDDYVNASAVAALPGGIA